MKKNPVMILASRSKARAALLREAGYCFVQEASDIPEPPPRPGTALGPYVRRLARLKAMAVAQRFPDAWVIGADTALVLETRIIGKPRNHHAAVNMLRALAGRTHRICSAVCVVAPPGRDGRRTVRTAVDTARVTLRDWPPARLRAHVAATRPIHWAGAYAVQDPVSCDIVECVGGDLATVIGLPMKKLERLLAGY
jgi:septum formation protein